MKLVESSNNDIITHIKSILQHVGLCEKYLLIIFWFKTIPRKIINAFYLGKIINVFI